MKKALFSFAAALACFSTVDAQLTLVKSWDLNADNPIEMTGGYYQWAADVHYSTSDFPTIGGTGTTVLLGSLDGLTLQGADKGFFIRHLGVDGVTMQSGILQNNSGGRVLGIKGAAVGNRIKFVASGENLGKLNAGKAITANGSAGTELYNYDKEISVRDEVNTIWMTVTAVDENGYCGVWFERSGYLMELEIYSVDPVTDPVSYTVKFVDENNNEIQEPVVVEGVQKGSKAEFFPAKYTTSVVTETGKYNYASNDFEEVTVAEGAVATVKFQSVAKLSYTINYVDAVEETVVASETGSVYEDATTASYKAFNVVNGTLYYSSKNKQLELPGGDTDAYSVIVTANEESDDILVSTPDVQIDELAGYGAVYYAEAEAVAPYPYAQAGASCGQAGQVVGCKNGQSNQLVQLGLFLPGNYYIFTEILANEGRNLVVRSYNSTPADALKDVDDAAMIFTGKGEILKKFTITEAMCDSVVEGVNYCALTLGGKDGKGDGTLYNQSADFDFVVIFAEGYEGAVGGPSAESTETAIKNIANVIENGEAYTISGAKAAEGAKGIVIKNGKKMLVK